MDGADAARTGAHTGPSPEGAKYADTAKARAKDAREAQQDDQIKRTGDTLYPASRAF